MGGCFVCARYPCQPLSRGGEGLRGASRAHGPLGGRGSELHSQVDRCTYGAKANASALCDSPVGALSALRPAARDDVQLKFVRYVSRCCAQEYLAHKKQPPPSGYVPHETQKNSEFTERKESFWGVGRGARAVPLRAGAGRAGPSNARSLSRDVVGEASCGHRRLRFPPRCGCPCRHRRPCCHFNGNARPWPALGWSSRPLEPCVFHTGLKGTAVPTRSRRDNFGRKKRLSTEGAASFR